MAVAIDPTRRNLLVCGVREIVFVFVWLRILI